MTSEPHFYERREREERELAAKAASPQVKAIHLELAESYLQLSGRSAIAPIRKMFASAG